MSTRNRISVSPRQQTALHAGLVAAVRVLRLDAGGLTALLQDEAARNPSLLLHEAPVTLSEPWPRWRGPIPGPSLPLDDVVLAAPPSLMAYVAATIDRIFPAGRDRAIALALGGGLEASGWLSRPLSEVMASTGATEAAVDAVLGRLQGEGPAGLFARNLAECLRLQVVDQGIRDQVLDCMIEHLDLLATGRTDRLARLCAVPEAEVMARLRRLRALDPKPGTQFDAEDRVAMREPDLILRSDGYGGWQLTLNRQALPQIGVKAGHTAAQVAAARHLRRVVALRGRTLLAVGEAVVAAQPAACAAGLGALRAMTMAEVAAQVGVHATTVSRVIAGAAMDTPHGLWRLRALFSGDRGGEVSSAGLRGRLTALVAAEDPARPLSDETLAGLLSEGGAQVARRTVAKYRAMQKIAPAHRRRQRPV